MNSFFRIFFASIAAMIVFSLIVFFIFLGFVSGLATRDKEETGSKAVLVLDLSQTFPEIAVNNPLAAFSTDKYDVPALYDVVRMIHHAKADSAVKGIYIKCGKNNNGQAASQEIRNALQDFKAGGKFVYAYADVISQGGYIVANTADKLYCNPLGGLDWRGFAIELAFLKGLLQKLEIEPQIFYAGKFKSATEPFREKEMTAANRLQLTELLHDLYGNFLYLAGNTRKIDSATLHQYADSLAIKYAADALRLGLVDGLKYDDEVKNEIKEILKVDRYDKINFVSMGKYAQAVDYKLRGRNQVAVIYAQGDIVDGKGDQGSIGGDTYRGLIRKARLNKDIKAIVVRINSGGGSAQASENMWRELTLAKQDKPVVVSFGDVAASGGYYMACTADSIFASPNTITGSIGVFSMIPNMQQFFDDKLGITFDGVKTGPYADMYTVTKPLTPMQKQYLQNSVDSIYNDFKTRVSRGRHMTMAYVDSIGQGRVWSGSMGVKLGLVDRIGGLEDAIACAARMAKVTDYRLKEFPEPYNLLDMIFGNYNQNSRQQAIQEELGTDGARMYNTIKRVKQMVGVTQARIPFEFTIE